jgi:hypothetical protein
MFNPANFVTNHPYQSMIYIFLYTNAVATMPSPTKDGKGFRGSAFYDWIFGFLHAMNIPRLLITLFPTLAGSVGLLSQNQTEKAVSSAALSSASKEADKTVEQAAVAASAVADAQIKSEK